MTIRDVASHAGVSPMTISRVVNESPSVSAETRQRVLASIDELGYVPNQVARGLSRSRTGAFGVVVPDLANPFFTLVLRGVEDVAWRSGYHVILCNTRADLERERQYLEDMVAFQVEGVLIVPVGDRSRPHMRRLARAKLPFVLIDRSISGFSGDVVQGDSVAGARTLVEHLIGLRHHRIGMISESDDVSTARDRKRGYREALVAAGCEFDEELVRQSSATDPQAARQAAEQLLSMPKPPTAIFAVNNIAVLGVVEAARERGLKIPGDLAVVCFDDVEHAARLCPFLTVMAQPAETFGTVATQLLLDRVTGRIDKEHRTVVLPPSLIIRKSCGYSDPSGAADLTDISIT